MCLLKAKDDFHVPGNIPLVYQYARYIKVPNMVVILQYVMSPCDGPLWFHATSTPRRGVSNHRA